MGHVKKKKKMVSLIAPIYCEEYVSEYLQHLGVVEKVISKW